MDYWDIKQRLSRVIVEELEVELNRKIYLIVRYFNEKLGKKGRDLVDYLVRNDDYILEGLIKLEVEQLSNRERRVYDNVLNYLVGEDNDVEEGMDEEVLNRAIEVSQELFREELEERYRET